MTGTAQPVCPSCQSLNIVYRVRGDTYLCRRCGQSWPAGKTKGGKGHADV